MMQRNSKRITLCIVILTLNLVFIWGNSLMPATVSGAISQWVGNLLRALFQTAAEDSPEGQHLLRKLAHFSEFAALGVWLTWLWGMLGEKLLPRLALPLLCGLTAACCDETIQLFVAGRCSSLLDVWIDTAGVILGIATLSIIHYFIEKRKTP